LHMRNHIKLARPARSSRVEIARTRPVALNRDMQPARPIARSKLAVLNRRIVAERKPAPSLQSFEPDPYVDYARFLTREGGVLFIHKDHDLRLRHTLWRLFAWTVTTYEGWLLFHRSPLHAGWLNLTCFLAFAIINWLIVRKPVEIYRKVEIRPDCLIIEEAEVFWLRLMEGGFPAFRPDSKGNQVLSGIYGTRYVEYLVARRFDEHDRMPEVFDAHLQEAMAQLWGRPV
jgi:hypothetical protein